MILAEFETQSFTLQTLAADKASAYAQLQKAWAKHVKIAAKWVTVNPQHLEQYKGDVNYYEIEVGDVLMGSELFLKAEVLA